MPAEVGTQWHLMGIALDVCIFNLQIELRTPVDFFLTALRCSDGRIILYGVPPAAYLAMPRIMAPQMAVNSLPPKMALARSSDLPSLSLGLSLWVWS